MVEQFLRCFKSYTSAIRVVNIEDAPWFVANDVCEVLGLNTQAISMHTGKLGKDEYTVLRRKFSSEPNSQNQTLTDLGGSKLSSITLISESGLYKLTMRSCVFC